MDAGRCVNPSHQSSSPVIQIYKDFLGNTGAGMEQTQNNRAIAALDDYRFHASNSGLSIPGIHDAIG